MAGARLVFLSGNRINFHFYPVSGEPDHDGAYVLLFRESRLSKLLYSIGAAHVLWKSIFYLSAAAIYAQNSNRSVGGGEDRWSQ